MEQLINDFSPGLFVMQALILLIIIFLMKKFAWKPILASLDARESEIKDAIESAKKAKEELAKLTTDKEALIKEAQLEKDTILKEAQATSTKIVDDAKETAKAEGAKLIEAAKASIETERKAAIADIKQTSAALAIEIAEKVIKNELKDKKAQEAIISSYLQEA